jgi:hypothetical protein
MNYDEKYYSANPQDGDQPAVWMLERYWQRNLGKGTVFEFCCGVGYFARRLSRHAKQINDARTLVQLTLTRPLFRQGNGENMVFTLEKRS